MAKSRSKNKSKQGLPKGIPHRKSTSFKSDLSSSPFESARTTTKSKHHVHNRKLSNNTRNAQSKLAEAIARRKSHLTVLKSNELKSNEFIDRRIGEARLEREGLTKEDAMLKRIVQERVRRSNKRAKFSLENDEDGGLTHRVRCFLQMQVLI
jgi:hypothetical protein